MSGQHEGLFTNILDKVQDLITDDDRREKTPPPPEDPPLETQCCGKPPGQPLLGTFEHDAGCRNHPDSVAKQEVAS